MTADLPAGTVTLLFTDIEGSTRMLQELGREAYVRALTEHRRLLREAFTSHGGVEVEMQGDSFFFAFPSAREAVAAAVTGQQALAEHAWESQPITVRIGLHTGEPMQADGLYAGLDVHHAARVMSAAHGGQVVLSARTADLVDGELDIELLDLGEHRLKDLTAPQHLYQAGDGDFPPLKTLTPRSNLPVAATPLIGRDAELARLTGLLRDGTRVITVTGTGGTGKTRLALQAAAELVDEISDGVHWIPLAALRDPALVTSTIAQALGATETLVEFVRDRNLLLVLDNFEHLLDAAPQLAPLLSSAPGLRLLATSRAPLRIEGEYEYPLDPLPARDAVTMFVERARAAGARLERSSVVNEICQRLDCLPLALELAAARSRLLGADALLARLDQRLPLLTGGRRDAPERHRTLHATIDWSHDLLDHAGKTLLARLSVFAGTFSLEAAEAVCDADVGTLAALADLSLLKPVGDGRFLMLETIREYAEERLEADGEAQPVRDRHADWFHRLALEAALHLRDQEQARWLDRLEDDLNNIRAALERADDDRALEIVAALGDFWSVHAHYREADRLLADLLSRNTAATELRAEGLRVAAEVAMGVGDHERSTRLSKEAIELCRSLGLDLLAARCLNNLGGAMFEAGDPAAAERYFAESAALRRRIGDVVGAARADSNRALVALERGDHDIAEGVFLATLSVFEESGDTAMVADTFENLAALALMRDDRQAAREWWRRAAAIYRTLRAPERLAFALEGLAAAAAADDDPTDALVLLGAADMLRELSGAPPSVSLEARRAGVRKAAAGLEPAVAEAAHARGFEMTFDEAVEAALAT